MWAAALPPIWLQAGWLVSTAVLCPSCTACSTKPHRCCPDRYLNGYSRETAFHVPPGYDRWFGIGEIGELPWPGACQPAFLPAFSVALLIDAVPCELCP